jgi:hypothetical protein
MKLLPYFCSLDSLLAGFETIIVPPSASPIVAANLARRVVDRTQVTVER